jgi:protein gp37
MAEATAISWCDSTFNPWIGCTKVSPACDNCYAARSTPARTLGVAWGAGQPRHRTAHATWRQPLMWEKHHEAFALAHGRRRRVFCGSLADVFDNEVPEAWRFELLDLIDRCPNLDWLLLTKRIGNVKNMVSDAMWSRLPHAWLGATVVDQEEAERDIPKLLAVPARVHFLSIEPMLGPIELGLQCENWSDVVMDPETGAYECCKACDYTGVGNAISWVICGGESGPNARPMSPDWARSLRDQCAAAGVPFHFKQWGEWLPVGQQPAGDAERWSKNYFDDRGIDARNYGKKTAGRLLDGVEHNGFPT